MYAAELPKPYSQTIDNATTMEPSPTIYIVYTASNNIPVARGQLVIVNTIPESVVELEFEDERPRPKHKLFLKPQKAIRQAPWQAKWRLRQQRPRDGLHS